MTGIHERTILRRPDRRRERLGTTGIGTGIGIPHGKLPGLTRAVWHLCSARASHCVSKAIDEQPVDLIFLLLGAGRPAGADHLKALALVSRLLRDRTVLRKSCAAPTMRDALVRAAHRPHRYGTPA